ncbi:MAG: hypothetical protein RR922_05680 [Clostridia bacterium]
MDLEKFIKHYESEITTSEIRVPFEKKKELQRKLDVKIGEQLNRYIVNYGALKFKKVQINDVDTMIKRTRYMREILDLSKQYIVLEILEDAEYILIDSKDEAYKYVGPDEIIDLGIKLEEYILTRFQSLVI